MAAPTAARACGGGRVDILLVSFHDMVQMRRDLPSKVALSSVVAGRSRVKWRDPKMRRGGSGRGKE
jgi:hypothetical protein